METTLSIPDPIFVAADDLAKQLGMSRSQLYATAVSRFIESFQDDKVTAGLDKVYGETSAVVDPLLQQMQLQALPEENWS